MPQTHYDAIVVGSGITGGWAAKELTEKGLKVLMVDRGRMVEHGKDYITEHKPVWDHEFRDLPLRDLYEKDYEVHKLLYAFTENSRHFYNNDRENPYDFDTENPEEFLWFRSGVVGGRSLLWGRQVYRWSDYDFEANVKENVAVDWPIRYDDIEPWYSYVEKFIGVSGEALNLPQLPDSEFLPPMSMSILEEHVKQKIAENYDDRIMTIGRVAVLTQEHNGRGACHYCGPCERGCSVGAYFSTQSSTLPAARATGNLTLVADCVVEKVNYDAETKRASGITVIDKHTKERREYTAKVIFMCASTIGTTAILLNSISETFPNGLANSSGTLGHYLMDHHLSQGAVGFFTGYEDKTIYGRRPNGIYIPRYRNLREDEELGYSRGYGFQGGGFPFGQSNATGFGVEFKKQMRENSGPWIFYMSGFGECLPYYENRIELNHKKLDPYGIPQVKIHFNWGENEAKMREAIVNDAKEILTKAGANFVMPFQNNSRGGEGIHEMGTARMGRDPATSVLNEWNQCHDVKNLFVTDGSCMTSASCVNPSLTYMALTARAVDYAVKQLESGLI